MDATQFSLVTQKFQIGSAVRNRKIWRRRSGFNSRAAILPNYRFPVYAKNGPSGGKETLRTHSSAAMRNVRTNVCALRIQTLLDPGSRSRDVIYQEVQLLADLQTADELLAGPTWARPLDRARPAAWRRPAQPVRIALVDDPARQGVAAQVKDGMLKAASALADAGYVMDEVEPPSIDLPATTALEMPAVGSTARLELMMVMYPPEIQGVRLVQLLPHSASCQSRAGPSALLCVD
jgi:hypothetical protein